MKRDRAWRYPLLRPAGHSSEESPGWRSIFRPPVLLPYDARFGLRISDWVVLNPDENVQDPPCRDHDGIQREVKEFVAVLATGKG